VGAGAWAVGAGVAGSIIAQLRIAWWRRRHPVISPKEYLSDLRDAAPYN
jgi:hypothetical protein